MLERLITWSIRHRRIVLALAAVFVALGVAAVIHTPVDAIPDLSENQVTVHAEWPGRSPEDVEKSVTALLAPGLRGLPGVRVVRTMSTLGTSMMDVIFDDGVSRETARARVAERLSLLSPQLPRDATPALAPDATAVGQVFWYTVEGVEHDLGELRSLQDKFIRPHLQSVPGVAEVASVGGARRELHVEADPERLATHEISLDEVVAAVSRSSATLAGGVLGEGAVALSLTGTTRAVSPEEVENAVVAERDGVPVLVRHVARVQFGPGPRWGLLEKDGREAVGGVVLMRHGANPREVIREVRERIRGLSAGLPAGVAVVPFYDRTELIDRAIRTSTTTLLAEMGVASLAILLVMNHVGGALVVCLAMPLAVLFSLTLMRLFGIPSNIMSLAGISISVGVLVDQAIVLTDNAMHHLRRKFGDSPATGDLAPYLEAPAREVGRPLFYSVLIMVLSFLPVFALQGLEGRMYTQLALTKTFALVGALLLTVTVLPALLPYVLRGRIRDESENWLVASFIAVYRPVLSWLLPRPAVAAWVVLMFLLGASTFLGSRVLTGVLAGVAGLTAACFGGRGGRWIGLGLTAGLAYLSTFATPLGREFMPPLQEGDLVDMPVTIPGVSAAQVADDLKARNALIRTFPEVEVVVGKAGRAETVTDPAPMEMVETLVNLRPREHWPRRHVGDGEIQEAGEAVRFAAVANGLLAVDAGGDAPANPPDERVRARTRFLFDAHTRDRWQAMGPFPSNGSDDRDRELALAGPEALAKAASAAFLENAYPAGALTREPSAEDERALEKAAMTALGTSLVLRQNTQETLIRELDTLLQVPGWANIWTQPIVNRIDMMATGIRTTVGVKVFGSDLGTIQGVAEKVANVLRTIPGAVDIVVDQSVGRGTLVMVPDRERAATYGITIASLANAFDAAVGGRLASTIWLKGEEIPVRVKYARDFCEDTRALLRIPVPRDSRTAPVSDGLGGVSTLSPHGHRGPPPPSTSPGNTLHSKGDFVHLSSVAALRRSEGPAMIRGEDGFPCAYVQLNVRGRDLVGFVEDAREAVREHVPLSPGIHVEWGGQYEHHIRVRDRLLLIVPLVMVLLCIVLWWTYRNLVDMLLVLGAIPGAIAGGLLLQALWGAEFSVAIWIGYIACMGMAVESAMIMLVYLREAINLRGGLAAISSVQALHETVLQGAVKRQRPKLLTEATTVLSLMPMLWATGTGAEITSGMALPVLGGVLLADEIVDLLIPVAFLQARAWMWTRLRTGK